ncbi:MAG: leucyl aminopeptidase family protein [Candidatus Puniceispirillaceae bacterium]
MTKFPLRQPDELGLVTDDVDARQLRLLTPQEYAGWRDAADNATQNWIGASGFAGSAGKACLLPATDTHDAVGIIDPVDAIWHAAAIATSLPAGRWSVAGPCDPAIDLTAVGLGWALAQYSFTTYRDAPDRDVRELSLATMPDEGTRARVIGLASGTAFCRDLINAPPNHMTPAGLEQAARHLADRFNASIEVTTGEALASDYPAIDTVGRAAEIAPRLIDLHWGDKGPKITLIGKGITFDSGGLDLKPSKAMELMKKDMGGAATVLGLASAVMMAGLTVRLRVLVPAAENAVSSKSMRPLDVIDTRAGLPVEVGNTDAEGRLVLADAITLACEDEPDFMIDFATLTGAARVALGTELPALFCNLDETASGILAAADAAADPLWRLPLFDAYERHLEAGHVALSSTGPSGYGGAITAALFLRRFAGKTTNWAHIDVMAWNLAGRAGRPKGGEAMGLRALFTYIERLAAG